MAADQKQDLLGSLTEAEQSALLRLARYSAQQHPSPPPPQQSLDAFDANLNLTVYVARAATVSKLQSGKRSEDLAEDGLDQEVIEAARRNEDKILEWIAKSPANLARFTADPVSALADEQLLDPATARAMLRYRDGLRSVLQPEPGTALASLVLKPLL